MNILSWNVRGIADAGGSGVSSFTSALSQETPWDIICLQEFTAVHSFFNNKTTDNHKLILTDPVLGQRRLAIVVNRNFTGSVGEGVFRNRCMAVPVDWGNLGVWLINAHLDPYSDPSAYQESRDGVYALAALAGTRKIVICVDAQAALGPRLDGDDPSVVGTAVSDGRSWKSTHFLNLMCELGLVLINTFDLPNDDCFTCHYDGKHQPRQIDHIAVAPSLRSIAGCTLLDCAAADTDHRCLSLRIEGGDTRRRLRYRNFSAETYQLDQ